MASLAEKVMLISGRAALGSSVLSPGANSMVGVVAVTPTRSSDGTARLRLARRLLGLLLVSAVLATGCLAVPPGTHLFTSSDGCTSTGDCPWGRGTPRNFYYAPTHELVVVPGQPLKVEAHELCHAHQDQEVRTELGIAPSLDMHEWYQTQEGRDYAALAAAHPHPYWSAIASEDTLLEDFAEACGRYLTYPLTGMFAGDETRNGYFAERGF